MSILTTLYRNGLWISPPLLVIGVLLLGRFILNIIRLEERSRIVSLPLVERQVVAFEEAGPVILCIKGPQFTSRFAGFSYELATEDGTRVEGRRLWFRPTTSGLSTVTVGIRQYEIPRPGGYILRIEGLKPDPAADAKCQLLFTRPHLARAVGNVIGIVLSAMLMIGSLVLFLLRLLVNKGQSIS
jgi:hypothetical protein